MLLAKQDECKDIAILESRSARESELHGAPHYLLPAGEEKSIRVNTICDCVPNERNPMKDQRRLFWIFKQ